MQPYKVNRLSLLRMRCGRGAGRCDAVIKILSAYILILKREICGIIAEQHLKRHRLEKMLLLHIAIWVLLSQPPSSAASDTGAFVVFSVSTVLIEYLADIIVRTAYV